MKRNFASWTISILSFVMMFSFTGCSQNQQLDDAKAAEKNEIVDLKKIIKQNTEETSRKLCYVKSGQDSGDKWRQGEGERQDKRRR